MNGSPPLVSRPFARPPNRSALDWVGDAGIIVHLPADLGRQLLIEVADALLAAPVLLTIVPFGIQELCAAAPGCEFLALGDIDYEQTEGYARAGARALVVDISVPGAGAWRQADLIADIRTWQAAWAEARI